MHVVQFGRAFLPRIELLLPWVILAALASFTYANFFQSPYPGFEFESDGRISVRYETANPENLLRVGDQIVRIGPVTWEQFESDMRQKFFPGAITGDIVPVQIVREGRSRSIDWIYPGPTGDQINDRLRGVWWLSFVFWFAGSATLFFIRPKDTRWKLLIAFNYLTGIGLASGGILSHWHIGQSAVILRSAVWLALPFYLHFHWNFPRKLGIVPTYIWGAIYSGAGLLAFAEWFQVFNDGLFYLGFAIAVVGSAFLLILQLFIQRGFRQEVLVLFISIVLILIPPTITSITSYSGTPTSNLNQSASLLTLPSLPGIYFFMVYRGQFRDLERKASRPIKIYLFAMLAGFGIVVFYSLLIARFELLTSGLGFSVFAIVLGALITTISFFPYIVLPALTGATYRPVESLGKLIIRPNRFVSTFIFLVITGSGMTLLIIIVDRIFRFPGDAVVIGIVAALAGGLLTAFAYKPFQRFIEQRMLNMPLPPTHLLETHAARITTSLERESLVHLLKHEILPTLFVRQSALLWLDPPGSNKPLFTLGISLEQLPNNGEIAILLESAGEVRHPQIVDGARSSYSWVRLALPLKLGEELLGVWVLGNRDPDDFYTPGEVAILQALANQTAIALTNISQSEQLRGLYQANIVRQEEERKRLALFLHDEVLNELAGLGMQIDRPDFTDHFLETFQSLNTNVRQIISGLRPMMLNYGLGLALEELVENLAEQSGGECEIHLDVHQIDTRFDPDFEAYLYWIVRQACENALRHARARRICLRGELNNDQVLLLVEDDGVGFKVEEQSSLLELLNKRHFGLVGMHERAAIIGAQLSIDSENGQGTRVTVIWKDD